MQVVIEGVLTSYNDLNSTGKTCLVILHGWGHSAAHWQPVALEMSKIVRVVTVDLPAFGNSAPLPGEPSVKEYSEFVENFIKKLKLKQVVLLGHSFGGQVAVDLAIRNPKTIQKLILVSPACIRNLSPNLKSRLARLLKPLFSFLPNKVSFYMKKFVASLDYQKSSDLQRQIFNRIIYVDYSVVLTKIKQKTFIIWGTEDITIPNSSKLLAEKIEKSKLIPLYGVDHNPHLTATEKLVRVLKACLD